MTWWQDLYDDALADILLDAEAAHAEAEPTAEGLMALCGLHRGDLVFDQCCGTGRLAKPLAERGVRVHGVEQCAAYVERARAACRGLDAEFVVGDAFEHVSREPCAAVFNWWTSFGYATSDHENRRMLDRAFESLGPGGSLVLDFHNAPALVRGFRPEVVDRLGDRTLIRRSRLDLSNGRLDKRWTWVDAGGRERSYDSSVRLYQPHELIELARACGFVDARCLGGVDGSALTLESSRCILWATKPA